MCHFAVNATDFSSHKNEWGGGVLSCPSLLAGPGRAWLPKVPTDQVACSCLKSHQNFDVSSDQAVIFGGWGWGKVGRVGVGGGAPKFLTEFYISGPQSSVAKFDYDRPSDLGD